MDLMLLSQGVQVFEFSLSPSLPPLSQTERESSANSSKFTHNVLALGMVTRVLRASLWICGVYNYSTYSTYRLSNNQQIVGREKQFWDVSAIHTHTHINKQTTNIRNKCFKVFANDLLDGADDMLWGSVADFSKNRHQRMLFLLGIDD